MSDEEKQALIHRYLLAYNDFDIDGMMDLLHADIVFKNIADGEINEQASGQSEFHQLAEQARGYFISRHQEPSNFKFNGDQVSIDITYQAVLAVDLPNGLKAGETLNLKGRSEFTFKDGLLAEISDYS